MSTKKYVSLDKLELYDEKIKKYLGDADAVVLQGAKDYTDDSLKLYEKAGAAATAKAEAIEAAKTETTTQVNALANGQVKANTEAIAAIKDDANIDSFADVVAALAEKQGVGDYATKAEAQGYADAKDGAIAEAKATGDAAKEVADANAEAIEAINHPDTGILAQAKADAKSKADAVQLNVDALAEKVGTVPEGQNVMGIIEKIQENAYDDTEIVERIDVVEGKVTTLVGEDANKSVRTIANEELAKQLIAEGAAESLDTLAEIAAWIQEHPEDASAMNEAIVALQNKVVLGTYVDGEETKEYATVKAYVEAAIAALNIGDYAAAADLTALAGRVTTLEGASATHATKTELGEVSDALDEYKTAHAGDYTNTQIEGKITEAVNGEVTRVDAELAKKVDKVEGKGLSTNDLTNELKGNYDAAYAHSQVAHAPVDAQANIIETVKVNGAALAVTGKAVDIAVPTKVSELTNDVPYLVAADIAGKAEQTALQAEIDRAKAAEKANADAIAAFVECSAEEINALFA